jgi:hypothetical protein
MEIETSKISVRREIVYSALLAGVVAGVFDITAAIVTSALRGVAPSAFYSRSLAGAVARKLTLVA